MKRRSTWERHKEMAEVGASLRVLLPLPHFVALTVSHSTLVLVIFDGAEGRRNT